jgi:mannose-1-phosphate guanylyltransferase
MLVTKVEDPSKYGVVISKPTGEITQFVEKPKDFVGDRINAGIYLFSKRVLNRIKLEPTSIEKQTFPSMAKDGQLYALTLDGFWMDIGQPKDYLIGQSLYLNFSEKFNASLIAPNTFANSPTLVGSLVVHPSAKFGKRCIIGPDVVIGENVVIGDDVYIERSTVMEGTKIGNGCKLYSSILGWNCQIGSKACLGYCVLGEGIVVKSGLLVLESKVPSEEKEKNKKSVDADISPSYATFLAECENGCLSVLCEKKVVDCVLSYVAAVDAKNLGAFDYPISQKYIIGALDRKTKKTEKHQKPQKPKKRKNQKKRKIK